MWAVDDLASLHGDIDHQLAEWLDGPWLGEGHVPDLDHLGHMRGHQVRPDSPALWDDVPGALVGRVLVVGTGDHLSVSLTHHEIGHALERMHQHADHEPWQLIMARCMPVLLAERYRNPYEWWAESWAMVAVGELGRLLRMLSEDQAAAERVASYHRRYYGLRR